MSADEREDADEIEAPVPGQFSVAAMLVAVTLLSALFALYRSLGQSGLLYWVILCLAIHSLWRRTLFVLVWGGLLGACLAGEYYDHYRRTTFAHYDPDDLNLHIWVIPGTLVGMMLGMGCRSIVTAFGRTPSTNGGDHGTLAP